jgi:hypothetical protein
MATSLPFLHSQQDPLTTLGATSGVLDWSKFEQGDGYDKFKKWQTKAACIESVDGCMAAFDDKSGRRTTMQQPTNEGISKSGQWWWLRVHVEL